MGKGKQLLKKAYLRYLQIFRPVKQQWNWLKSKYLTRQNGKKLVIVIFVIGLVSLIKVNWGLLAKPPAINSLTDFRTAIETQWNLRLFWLGIFYLVATACYFLLRLPFLNIEQLKVPGLEYKLQAQEQKKIADQVIETNRELELTRLNILNMFTQPEFKKTVKHYVTRDQFDMTGALETLAASYRKYLLDGNNIEIRSGVVVVQNGTMVDSIEDLPVKLQLVLHDVMKSGEKILTGDKLSILAFPVKGQEESSEYCLFYAQSLTPDIKLNEADYLMLITAWDIIIGSIPPVLPQKKQNGIMKPKDVKGGMNREQGDKSSSKTAHTQSSSS